MITPWPRGRNPFDESGVEHGPDGVAFYTDRPDSLVHMLRASVERERSATALLEVGGDSVSYAELWIVRPASPAAFARRVWRAATAWP